MSNPLASSEWSPSVAARDANHLDLFITGYDGHVYTTWWNPSLTDWGRITLKAWKDLGGTLPLPTSTPSGRRLERLRVAVTGASETWLG
jgi:hypothetical protein